MVHLTALVAPGTTGIHVGGWVTRVSASKPDRRYGPITYNTAEGTGSYGRGSLVKYDVSEGTYRCQQVCLQVAAVQAVPWVGLKIHLASPHEIWVPTKSGAKTSVRVRQWSLTISSGCEGNEC